VVKGQDKLTLLSLVDVVGTMVLGTMVLGTTVLGKIPAPAYSWRVALIFATVSAIGLALNLLISVCKLAYI
jgi:hypothetical protein